MDGWCKLVGDKLTDWTIVKTHYDMKIEESTQNWKDWVTTLKLEIMTVFTNALKLEIKPDRFNLV